jgi:nitronate monooxygenase
VRSLPWPQESTARVQRNEFVRRWVGREAELAEQAGVEGPPYLQSFADGAPDTTAVWFGEAAGLVESVEPAATIIERMVADAVA